MKKKKGAISLFLVIVLFSCVFLSALFIDASRVLLAKRSVRNAANSAARSALAHYDSKLSKEYGIFAVDQKTGEEAFKRYFITSIELSHNDGFDILSMQPKQEDIKVVLSQPITDGDVMQEGMNEYSKYRVVVNSSVGVIEKIRGFFGGAPQVFNAADVGKTAVEQLKDQAKEMGTTVRNLLSSGMKTQTDRAKASVRNLLNNRTTKLSDEEKGYDAIEKNLNDAQTANNNVLTAADQYDTTNKEQAQILDNTKQQAAGKYWDEETETWKDDQPLDVKVEEPTTDLDTLSDQAREQKEEVDQEIASSRKKYNTNKAQIDAKTDRVVELNVKINTLNAEIQTLKDKIEPLQAEVEKLNQTVNSMQGTKESEEREQRRLEKENLELQDEHDEDPYDYNLDEARKNMSSSQFSSFKSEFKELKKELEKAIECEENGGLTVVDMLLGVKSVQAAEQDILDHLESGGISNPKTDAQLEMEENAAKIKELSTAIGEKADVIKDIKEYQIKPKQKQLDDWNAEKKAKEKELEAAKAEKERLLNEIDALYDGIVAAGKTTTALTVPDLSDKDKQEFHSAATDESGDESFMKLMSDFFGIVEGASWLKEELCKVSTTTNVSIHNLSWRNFVGFEAIVDDVWGMVSRLGEDANGIRTLIKGEGEAGDAMLFTDYVFSNCTFLTSQTPRSNRHFQIAEIEYIISGETSQLKAFLVTLTDIFMLRMVINFADYMISSAIPEIVTRTLTALGRALLSSVSDVAKLVFTLESDESASCGLSPSLQRIRLTYSDHLRLSMMLKGINHNQRMAMMERFETMMRRTYEHKNWGEIDTRMTSISADVAVEVDLVMLTLPIFEILLPEDNAILQDGKFIVREHVALTY